MIHLLVLREHLKNIYQKYSRFLDSLFRFAAGLLTFLAANEDNLIMTDTASTPKITLGFAISGELFNQINK